MQQVHGNVELLIGRDLHGWVFLPDAPISRATVSILVDDVQVAEAVADAFRDDLFEAGIGDGLHSFIAELPIEMFDGSSRQVAVIEKSSGLPLPNPSPERFFKAEQASLVAPPVAGAAYIHLLFDESYYSRQLSISPPNLLDHYTSVGWRLGLDPHPLFNTEYYLHNVQGDVQSDPVSHYLSRPSTENCRTHPLFDPAAYSRRRPDIHVAGIPALVHYLMFGHKEGELISEFFSDDYYESECPGVRSLGFIPIVHYLSFGWREGRKPHPEFDPIIFADIAGLKANIEPYTCLVSSIRNGLLRGLGSSRADVDQSFIILNLSKTLTTLMCLYFLERNSDLSSSEVIVVDNGSSQEQFKLLCQFAGACNIIRLDQNVGFGEGNNVGVDRAGGKLLVFLNNDAFVTPGWNEPLRQVLDTEPTVGAVGPKFLYADGRLQEAGAMISSDGTALQRGKHLDPSSPAFNKMGPVDYVSAAALMVRSDYFRKALGFDLCWDPAYYEDADLCLKLRLLGGATWYVPESVVYHLENATSSDRTLDLRLHNIVGLNRLKFVSRWGAFLDDGVEPTNLFPSIETAAASTGVKPRLCLYTPYPLVPGGGERYLLSIAHAMREHYDCILMTPSGCSSARIQTMARELELNLSNLAVKKWADVATIGSVEVFICMGNELLPPVKPFARLNIFHCQFPFPMLPGHYVRDWEKLNGYDGIIVNSEFTLRHYKDAAAAIHLAIPVCYILSPPVPQVGGDSDLTRRAKGRILNIGRFAPGGHCKRQDVMIEAFKKLHANSDEVIELHLAGALGSNSDAREYLTKLQKEARGFPIRFHVNPSPSEIKDLYHSSSIYWHLTGINDNVDDYPERFEHFGITIVEAMSAGCIPIVLFYGGPSGIIRNGRDGFLIYDANGLRDTTKLVLSNPSEELELIRAQAIATASLYSPVRFGEKLKTIVAQLPTSGSA